MAKKIAAPFKAARKAPAAKKAPLKKMAQKAPQKGVAKKKLPATLDWGKKVPKDHLGYLSKEEMAVLQKHRTFKGKRNYSGVPAFPDPGDTGYGDKGQGTKSSTGTTSKSSGNTSSVGGGGGGGGGSTGSRGSSTGSVGSRSGSNTPGNSGGGAGTGQGGQNSGSRGAGSNYGPGSGRPGTTSGGGNYNSGVAGSRNGGVSTQKPGMGGNAGTVSKGPVSPMAGQGTSFENPLAARQDVLNKVYGVEDIRGKQNMPQQPYWDGSQVVNPNYPSSFPDYRQIEKNRIANDDTLARQMQIRDPYRTPAEIKLRADINRDSFAKADLARARRSMGLDDIRSHVPDPTAGSQNRINSDLTRGTPVGSGRGAGSVGGGGWRAGGLATRMKTGGIVKSQPRKTFKKK